MHIDRHGMTAKQCEEIDQHLDRANAVYAVLLADYRRVRAALANIAESVMSGEMTISMVDQGTRVTCNIDNALSALDDCPER